MHQVNALIANFDTWPGKQPLDFIVRLPAESAVVLFFTHAGPPI
jgi:hypothetical protein